MSEANYILADLALARRLERAEAQSNAGFVETRAKVNPASGACSIEVAGAYAMFDGAHSPCTQTFALGMFQPVTQPDLESIEEFYQARQAPVFHEVSPLADPSALALLNERGYHPIEFTSMLFRPLQRGLQLNDSVNERITVRLAQAHEHELWAQTAATGWSELAAAADFMLELSSISVQWPGMSAFFAELDGKPIATGGLILRDGVALLAGASTIPAGRNQGAQLALLENRLRYAVEQGCDLALMGAAPGSASQRNAERQGFRIAYTRIKWQLGE